MLLICNRPRPLEYQSGIYYGYLGIVDVTSLDPNNQLATRSYFPATTENGGLEVIPLPHLIEDSMRIELEDKVLFCLRDILEQRREK